MKINFCSAPPGSGKTYQIIKRACEWAKLGRRVIILQPTKELIEKTVQGELLRRPDAPTYKIFHGDTVSGSVAHNLTEYLKWTDDEGQIVFATHQVLPYVGFWPNQETWHVFVDEALQVHRHNSYKVPDTHRLITDLITLEPYNSVYSRVKVADKAEMERIARNINHDQIYETLRELAQTLLNQHWNSFVDTEEYEKLKARKQRQLSVHSVLIPSVLKGFKSVVIASANFTDSMIYRVWSAKGVDFKEDHGLTSSLLFREHSNGQLITISYADESSWSKYRRLTKLAPAPDQNATVMDAIVQAAKAKLADKDFVWQANKSVQDGLFDGKGERLPNMPHGLNNYSHINNVVFLSSLNPRSDHFRFLETQGISGPEVRRAIYHEALYQSVMRTSIRDPKNIEPKTVIIPDISAAKYLCGLFPGSQIEMLETDIPKLERPKTGRPRKYQSDKDRKTQYRQRQKQRLLNELFQLKDGPYPIEGELVNGQAEPLTSEAYEAVWDNVAAKLRHAGYAVGNKDQQTSNNSRPSGLDVSKRTPAGFFYAPCQAKNPTDSFFWSYIEAPRQLLDPVPWIENSVVPFRAPFIPRDRSYDGRQVYQQKVNLAAVEEATKQWKQSREHPGTGNDGFFSLALSLRSAGMSIDEIERKLHEEARYGRSPGERRSQIRSIMQSLQQPCRKAG